MNSVQKAFIWLGGASVETLAACGVYERMKYAALGATLLVPAVAGLLAGFYTFHSLTHDVVLSSAIAILWALGLVVIDRAILVTYRKSQRQMMSVLLRMGIALVAGILIAHMLVLFIFRDQIDHRLEQDRRGAIAQLSRGAQEQIQLARQMEEARNASAIKAKEDQIKTLQADKDNLLLFVRKGMQERLLRSKDDEITLAYRDLDRLQQRQSYEETRRVEARLAEDVQKERQRNFDDVLSRTSALHDVIRERAQNGDWSALVAYVLLVLLLLALDTLPIAIKVMLPLDTYERVLSRNLEELEKRFMLQAEQQWQIFEIQTRQQAQAHCLLQSPVPQPADAPRELTSSQLPN